MRQFIVAHENLFPQDVIRDPTTGAITTVINPNLNLTGAVVEGLDYEAIYILDSAIFGHGDFGRFTFTLNGTYLSRFELQISPDTSPIWALGFVCISTNLDRLAAAHSSLCQRVLGRSGSHLARRLRYWRDCSLHRPVSR